MSLFKPNRRLLMLALIALAGCGYTPAFAPSGPAANLPIQISVDAPDNRNEFLFVQQLEKRVGRPIQPLYRLSYKIDTTLDGIGVTPRQEIFRNSIVGKATFSVIDTSTDQIITRGSVDTFTSYTVASVDPSAIPPSTNATISSDSAKRDAYARLMVILADKLVTRLIVTAGTWSK
ncbi:MAG: hypothetical protein KUG69_11585 [Marinosulfonomonas sp.]|nr:hypothetical protein [Marinosulfonomonas sp.]